MNVENDTAQHRFHVVLPEGEGELVYQRPAGDTIELVHTEVAPALRGRGVAEALAEAAFTYARAHGLGVVATCPYVKRWLTKRPEQRDIVVG